MKIAILGAGALGCYYGARLVEAGEEVCFIMRSACEYVQQHGLRISSVEGDINLPRVRAVNSAAECGPVDLVVVGWKTCCNPQFAEALPPLLHEHTRVVTLQNGMGNAEEIARFVPAERVFIGLCFVCCMVQSPGCITHLEGGNIQFAPLVPTESGLAGAQELAALFERAKIKTSAFLHSEQILWCKLTWNIPFNGLCLAHGGISVEELFRMPAEVERARRIIEEVCVAAEKRGFPLPKDIVQYQMDRTELMGPFIPSSAVDYNMGRPVEYDAIWGTPLKRALEVGAPVPLWQALCADILARLHPGS
ncbi:MAG: 2-dehydropantoate 2-reductase [Akkermansiaceae bacterium]|nr:2-dehydropantoate 2-reductase [Akkermansiaceae bacterium]